MKSEEMLIEVLDRLGYYFWTVEGEYDFSSCKSPQARQILEMLADINNERWKEI